MWFQKFPRLTVDVIIPNSEGKVLLIKRGHEPFKGMWCLPGGMVENGEEVEDAAIREVQEEVDITVVIERVLGIYSKPQRDPRGHFISIALVAQPTDAAPRITEEAPAHQYIEPGSGLPMAFDHSGILLHHVLSLQGDGRAFLR